MNKRLTIYLLIAFVIGFGTATNPAVHNFLTENNVISSAVTLIPADAAKNNESLVDLSSFWETYNKIQLEYVDNSALEEQSDVSYGAAKGLVKALNDPYSSFLDPEETTQFRESLDGELEGIGAEITIKEGKLMVITPLKESPAENAGIMPGDYIYKIDGEVSDGMSIHEAVGKIKGPKGTNVVLTIFRESEDVVIEPLEIEVTRDKIVIESVTSEMLENDIVFVSINQFSDDTTREFKKAVREIMVKKPKGVIIDLRFNGGGYLDTAVGILSEIIPGKQKIVSTKGRKNDNNKIFYSDGSARLDKLPMVVLINKGSASASEIVAGAVQDLQRGIIIGEQSFGKGSVQEVFNLADSSSLIITVAKWYTPLEFSVDKVGITPDRVIPMTADDYENDLDPQLKEAVNYLSTL
ncbi:S41 family peptidase [Patescibacteria group bacterium]|nr:S41 family peptidase [Patescibacteria group bacterium]